MKTVFSEKGIDGDTSGEANFSPLFSNPSAGNGFRESTQISQVEADWQPMTTNSLSDLLERRNGKGRMQNGVPISHTSTNMPNGSFNTDFHAENSHNSHASEVSSNNFHEGFARVEPKLDAREIEKLKAHAYQEGYQQGFTQGHQQGFQKGDSESRMIWQKKIDKIESMLLSMGEVREQLFQKAREDIFRIVTIVPRKVLRFAMKLDPRAITSLVGSVLEDIPRQDRVVVKVAPDDLSLLEEGIPDLKRRLGGYTQVEVESSTQVTGGGALIVLESGRVEATIDRQMETFEQRAKEWILGSEPIDLESEAISSTYTPL